MSILIKIFFHIIPFIIERKTVGLLIFLFPLLFLPQIIYSQYDNIKFSSLTVEDGLSEDKVYCALQDSKGFLWFGTASGLNRYDGYNFKIYSYNPNKTGSDSVNAAREVSDEGDKLKAAQGRPPGGMLLGLARSTHADEEIRAKKLSKLPEYQWQRKLKHMLDPNGVGSGNYFWGADPSSEG